MSKEDFKKNKINIIDKNEKQEKIISINLEEENNIKNYTPITQKDTNNIANNNIHVNIITFSGSSNNKNIISFNKTKSSNNSKNSDKSQKMPIKIPKFKMKINNNSTNSKSAEKINKEKKNAILIKINKVNIENKKESKYTLIDCITTLISFSKKN